jgi:hypothetical protein
VTKQEERKALSKKVALASLASIVICIALIVFSKMAQSNGDLIRALILMITSNFVTLVYLFGVRYYFKKIQALDERAKK